MNRNDLSRDSFLKGFILKDSADLNGHQFAKVKNMRGMKEKAAKAHITDGDMHRRLIFGGESRLARKGNTNMLPFIDHSDRLYHIFFQETNINACSSFVHEY